MVLYRYRCRQPADLLFVTDDDDADEKVKEEVINGEEE